MRWVTCLTVNELHLNLSSNSVWSPSLTDQGGLVNEIAIQQTYVLGGPYLRTVSGKQKQGKPITAICTPRRTAFDLCVEKFLGTNGKMALKWFHHHFYWWLFTSIKRQRMRSEGKGLMVTASYFQPLVWITLPHNDYSEMGSLVDRKESEISY